MNNSTDQKIKETIIRFKKKFVHWNENMQTDFVAYQESKRMEQFLESELSQIVKETAEDICKITDDIETKYYGNTSLEGWKAFKHIRNNIRDKYDLKQKHSKCTHNEYDVTCPCWHDGFMTSEAENGFNWKRKFEEKLISEIEEMKPIDGSPDGGLASQMIQIERSAMTRIQTLIKTGGEE